MLGFEVLAYLYQKPKHDSVFSLFEVPYMIEY